MSFSEYAKAQGLEKKKIPFRKWLGDRDELSEEMVEAAHLYGWPEVATWLMAEHDMPDYSPDTLQRFFAKANK